VCVCVCVVQRQPNNVPIRSWLYIEGHLSRRRTLNWRHQPQFWYEIVVPWNGKGVVLPIGGASLRSIGVDGATPLQTTTEWMSPNRIRKH